MRKKTQEQLVRHFLLSAACVIGIYVEHRMLVRRVVKLDTKLDYLTRRAGEDHWQIYGEALADLIGHEDRRQRATGAQVPRDQSE